MPEIKLLQHEPLEWHTGMNRRAPLDANADHALQVSHADLGMFGGHVVHDVFEVFFGVGRAMIDTNACWRI